MLIKPTIGRVVWYWPPGRPHTEQPNAAIIAFVHDDQVINVAGFDHDGQLFSVHNVLLIQDPESYGNPSGGGWCKWMPYQVGQAMRNGGVSPEGGTVTLP